MKRLEGFQRGKAITVDFEGESISAHEGEPVACSLLASGEFVFSRSIKYHRPRGPFCMEGSCSHCLLRVDGVPNVFTCQTPARAGMRLDRQNAYPSVKVDIFESIDWLFPRGLDHHEMFAGVPVAEHVMAKVARHLAGLGLLPEKEAPARMPAETLRVSIAIAGGGVAGSAAAKVLAERGASFALLEREDVLGGKLRSGAVPKDAEKPLSSADLPKGSVRINTTAVGLYDDEHGRYFAAVSHGPEGLRLLKVYAEQFLVCIGGHPRLPPFENNDLPGVLAGPAASALIRRHGILPGENVAVVGQGESLKLLAELLKASGAQLAAVVDLSGADPGPNAFPGTVSGRELKARGRSQVAGLAFTRKDGEKMKVRCDLVAVALPPSPSFELARQGGAKVVFRPELGAFAVEADESGRTAAKDIFVAGGVTGGLDVRASAESGRRAAQALLGGGR